GAGIGVGRLWRSAWRDVPALRKSALRNVCGLRRVFSDRIRQGCRGGSRTLPPQNGRVRSQRIRNDSGAGVGGAAQQAGALSGGDSRFDGAPEGPRPKSTGLPFGIAVVSVGGRL